MDFNNYSFYCAPRKDTFRLVLHIAVLVLLLFAASCDCAYYKWNIRKGIPSRYVPLSDYRTGDLILFFEHGHDFIAYPGHVGIVVELPRYGQKFVWDLQVYNSPTALKRLSCYLHSCRAKCKSKTYAYHHRGPLIDSDVLLSLIKSMSTGVHYKAQALHAHLNFCGQVLFGLPGIPDFLPAVTNSELHSCSSAVMTLLIKAQVIDPSVLQSFPVLPIYPQNFLHPDWDLNQYMLRPHCYELVQLQ